MAPRPRGPPLPPEHPPPLPAAAAVTTIRATTVAAAVMVGAAAVATMQAPVQTAAAVVETAGEEGVGAAAKAELGAEVLSDLRGCRSARHCASARAEVPQHRSSAVVGLQFHITTHVRR